MGEEKKLCDEENPKKEGEGLVEVGRWKKIRDEEGKKRKQQHQQQ